MRMYSVLVISLCFIVLGVLPANAQFGRDRNNNRNSNNQADEVCVYRDNYFQGAERCFRAGEEIPNLADNGSGISSIHIYGRARVTLYEDANFRGNSREFTSDVNDLAQVQMSGSRTWNDRSRSIRVTSDNLDYGSNRSDDRIRPGNRRGQQGRQQGSVCVYEDANYQGRSQCWAAGEEVADLARISSWGDRISSIRLDGNARVDVYWDHNFWGERLTINRDVPDLAQIRRGASTWDNQISSLEVLGSQANSSNNRSYRFDAR